MGLDIELTIGFNQQVGRGQQQRAPRSRNFHLRTVERVMVYFSTSARSDSLDNRFGFDTGSFMVPPRSV